MFAYLCYGGASARSESTPHSYNYMPKKRITASVGDLSRSALDCIRDRATRRWSWQFIGPNRRNTHAPGRVRAVDPVKLKGCGSGTPSSYCVTAGQASYTSLSRHTSKIFLRRQVRVRATLVLEHRELWLVLSPLLWRKGKSYWLEQTGNCSISHCGTLYHYS